MILKALKYGTIVGVVGLVTGGLLFGDDLISYARSSAGAVRSAVKESVPVEFELRRARDLLDQIIPEMHANVRLIAQEEVEIASLVRDIEVSQRNLKDETQKIGALRSMLDSQQTTFYVSDTKYARGEVRSDLARRLERVKEAQVILAGKEKLIEARRRSLAASRGALERTRSQKGLLEDRIDALASQNRLVQATAVGTKIDFDQSKLAQTEKLIAQIKKRLDIAERVLAHESRFVQPIPMDTVNEQELLDQVDAFLGRDETDIATGDRVSVR